MTKAKNFDNCIIYKLVCFDPTYSEVYVGSTTNFKQRKTNHKSRCYNEKTKQYNYKVYQYIREHGGFGNFTMVEIEKFPCVDNRQLEAREEYWRKELHATLNARQSFSTDEEKLIQKNEYNKIWYDTNKEKRKAYLLANKERIKKYKKEYRLRKKLEKLNNEIPETNIIEN
jgi:predicted GIY-YIG superfamily endonuclease